MMTTTSYLQIYPDYYECKEECDSFNTNYNKESNNIRYKNFKQIHFTAGDEDQFQTYRHNKNSNEKIVENIKDDNLFYDKKLFLEWDKFKNIEVITVSNTFKYIFYKFKKGIFVKILNNELKVFLPFSNVNFINEWHDNIKISNDYKDIYDYFRHISELEGRQFHINSINKYVNSWYSNNCLVRYEYPINEGDTNVSSIKNMLEELCKNREIPDIEFFINRRDYPLLSINGFEPYYHLWNSNKKPLVSHNYDKYSPILSMSSSEDFADILMPCYEDWIRIQNKENKWFPKTRQNYENDTFNTKWKDKKSTAVFRGSSTGEGIDIETNKRLFVSHLSTKNLVDENNIPYLDAGITKWNFRPKKLINSPYLQTIDIKKLNFTLVPRLTPAEQSQYKYIIHIDGNVSAFRLSYELSMNSIILIVKSKWKCWYSDILVPYIHYVPINEDCSNLIEQIKWCKENDDKCEIIAKNAKNFYNKYLQKEGILDYFQKLLVDIKKEIGIYFYNETNFLDIQFKEEKNYFDTVVLKYPSTKKTLKDVVSIPNNNRSYGLLKGVHYLINMILNNSNFEKEVKENDIIFKNKLGIVKKFNIANFDFAIKSSTDVNKINEYIHETFVGINVINNIVKEIPNYVYNFGLYKTEENKINIITEFISNQTLQMYIMSNDFKFTDFIVILLQICLALEVAQQKCNFVHYDLTTWNIMLKYLDEPVYIDYNINNKVIQIKTTIIPVIIDYGKSHVSYNNNHYGLINVCKFDKTFDMLSIFITSIYQISVSQKLSNYDFYNFLILANFISGTKYCKFKFKNSKDIKNFFYSAKKYSNLTNDNKYELNNYRPLDLFEYICKNLNYKIHIEYKNFYNSFMDRGDGKQVFEYILSNNNNDKINSFVNVFKNIQKVSFEKLNKISTLYLIQNLENTLNSINDQFIFFLSNEKINSNPYKKLFLDTIKYLKYEFKKINDTPIELEQRNNLQNFSRINLENYDENIFLNPKKIKIIINNIKNIETIFHLNNISNDIVNKNMIQLILLNNGAFKVNKKFYINKYYDLLSLDSSIILNNITNINTLKNVINIIYEDNITNIKNQDNKLVLEYYNEILEIKNILNQKIKKKLN